MKLLYNVQGKGDNRNDVFIDFDSIAERHVIFFPGDVQVSFSFAFRMYFRVLEILNMKY